MEQKYKQNKTKNIPGKKKNENWSPELPFIRMKLGTLQTNW